MQQDQEAMQEQIDSLNSRKNALEDEISMSKVKQILHLFPKYNFPAANCCFSHLGLKFLGYRKDEKCIHRRLRKWCLFILTIYFPKSVSS